ncbi:MAG: hypothetical protein AAF957_01185 [Planctomycetota bacterium]
MSPRHHLLSLSALLSLGASAQVPTALLRSGEPIPGIATHDFSGVAWLGTNHDGGLVANISGNDSGQFTDFLWGSVGGGALGELRRAGLQGPHLLTNIRRECAGAGASQTYMGNLSGAGETLMVDETVIATVGDATAPGGGSWIRFSEPFLDTAGDVWFRGRYTTTGNSRIGLFRGAFLTPVLLAGDVVMGLPTTVNTGGAPNTEHDVAHDGSQWIGTVTDANSREAVVRSGEVLQAGGVPLITGNLLPPGISMGPNERYNNFDQVQTAPGDQWAVIAGTPVGMILRDEGLFVRNTNVVDGFVFTGELRAIAMNRFGGLAWIGRVEAAGGVRKYAVFRERTLMYMEGDDVDIDFDGVVDPGYTITDIIGSAGRLAYTEDGRIWATVRITTPSGGSPFAVIGVGQAFGQPYCTSVANSSGRAAEIQAVGTPLLVENELYLRCVDMPTGTFGYFLTSRTQGLVMNPGGSQGNLCLAGGIGRYIADVKNSGSSGSIEVRVDVQAIPQPTGAVAAMAGEAWNFQCWFRDANPTVTSNLSNGIEVTFL